MGSRVNVPRLVLFVAILGGAVWAAVTGNLGPYIIVVLVLSLVLFVAAAIFAGFVTEVSKIFRR